MIKKFFFFLFLVCISFEVTAQDEEISTCTPSGIEQDDEGNLIYLACKPDWFDEVCGTNIREIEWVDCLIRLMGMHKIVPWNKEHFSRVYGENSTATGMYSYETGHALHARQQGRYIRYLVPGYPIQYNTESGTYNGRFGFGVQDLPYGDLSPGDIVTRADITNFIYLRRDSYDFRGIQATVVTATGNEDDDRERRMPLGLTDDNVNLPFPVLAGGYSYHGWVFGCVFDEIFDDDCVGIIRSYDPDERSSGSNYCGEKAKEICLLATYDDPIRLTVIGTSIATAFLGASIWSVAYFLKHKYSGWSKEMTQLDYTTLATAIVKSCAIDIGPPGPDPENGLGVLSLDCLHDDSDDGFIDNPLSVVKDNLYLLPHEGYVKPFLSEFPPNTPNRIEVDIRVFLQGMIKE